MAGFVFKKTLSGHNTAPLVRHIVKTSEVITKGDAVRITDGYVIPSGATATIYGVADETVTGDGTKTVQIIPAEGAVFAATANATLAQAVCGTYCDSTGGTGAQVIDTSTASTTGQFIVVKTDGATAVEVMVHERQV